MYNRVIQRKNYLWYNTSYQYLGLSFEGKVSNVRLNRGLHRLHELQEIPVYELHEHGMLPCRHKVHAKLASSLNLQTIVRSTGLQGGIVKRGR